VSYQPDRFTALVDACVLASALKRNMVLSLSEAQFFRIRWSAKIMTETERTIAKLLKRKGAPDHKAAAKLQCERMNLAFEEANVSGFEPLEASLSEINKKDRHVLAAAIKSSASVIVTDNLRDFDSVYCSQFDIEPLSSDAFLADCIELSPSASMATLRTMRERLKNPEITPETFITYCEGQALPKTATLMLEYKASL